MPLSLDVAFTSSDGTQYPSNWLRSSTAADRWNDTEPTNSVFSVGNSVNTSGNGVDFMAYLFTAIPGFSAFGSYGGNGNAEGPMVNIGFSPEWLMVKDVGDTNSWWIWSPEMDSSNPTINTLQANANDAQYTGTAHGLDILSNGFKWRGTDDDVNASGRTYIYAAFAEHPFKTARAH